MKKSKNSDGSRNLSGDETQLWQNVVTDVQPLKRPERTMPPGDVSPLKERAVDRGSARAGTTIVESRLSESFVKQSPRAPEPDLEHGIAPGVDKRTIMKLRRGQIPVESQIDLHRFTQEQAHRALDSFLAASQRAGRRCVLVITGKGYRSDGSGGVLRRGVPHWLNLPPNRARVLAFCHASQSHGGEGALYVLLRRLKR